MCLLLNFFFFFPFSKLTPKLVQTTTNFISCYITYNINFTKSQNSSILLHHKANISNTWLQSQIQSSIIMSAASVYVNLHLDTLSGAHVIYKPSCYIVKFHMFMVVPLPSIPHQQVLTPTDILCTSVLSCHLLSHLPTVTLGQLSPPWALSCHIICSPYYNCLPLFFHLYTSFSHIPKSSIHTITPPLSCQVTTLPISNLMYPLEGLSSCFISIANLKPRSLHILSHH